MNTHAGTPDRAQDSLPEGLAVQQRDRETALLTLRRLRREARDEIDRLLHFLDASDIDPDLEDGFDDEPTGDDEQTLGWTDLESRWGCHAPNLDDCEADESEDEPSLGSLTSSSAGGDQSRWGQGGGNDLEDEHDGAEPDNDAELDKADEEPNLGWTQDGSLGASNDQELDDVRLGNIKAPRDQLAGDHALNCISVQPSNCRRLRYIGDLTSDQYSKLKPRIQDWRTKATPPAGEGARV